MSKLHSTFAVTSFLFVAACVACNKPATNVSAAASGDSADSPPSLEQTLTTHAPAVDVANADDIKITVVDGPAYEAELDKHLGKVVLVDFWATWCEPCRENFPHIVKLGQEHAANGLAVVSMSVDEPGSEVTIRKFLADQGADFTNLVSKFGAGTETAEAFEMRGDVPLYRLYDRLGILRYQFTDHEPQEINHGEPMDMLDQRVKELLSEMSAE